MEDSPRDDVQTTDPIERTGSAPKSSSRSETQGEWGESMSLPQDDAELLQSLEDFWAGDHRGWQEGYAGLLLPVKYDLFGSCCEDEKAIETRYNGQSCGLYTHTLLEFLKSCNAERRIPTLGQIHNHLLATFKNETIKTRKSQTPIFVGNRERHWLRHTKDTYMRSLSVLSSSYNRPILSEGSAQGVTRGSTYAIYKWHETDPGDLSQKPQVEVTEVRADTSITKWITTPCETPIGFQAVLAKYKVDKPLVRVDKALISAGGDISEKYNELCEFINQENDYDDSEPSMVDFEEGSAPYHISVGDDLMYRLLDSSNREPVPRFPASDDVGVFYSHLLHMARFESLLKLQNPFHPEWIRDSLKIVINETDITPHCIPNGGRPRDYEPLDVSAGENKVEIHNKTNRSLSIAGLNFSPFWGAQLFYPQNEDFDVIPGNQSKTMNWPAASLPPHWDQSTDYIDYAKIFISEKQLSINTFRSVEMQDLDEGTGITVERGDDSLDELLDSIGMPGRGFTRDHVSTVSPWITLMFKIRTRN